MTEKSSQSAIQVMVVGPGQETEGGITEVIRRVIVHLERQQNVSAFWVATHRSGSTFGKIKAALGGIWQAFRYMPRVNVVHIHSSAYVSFVRKSLIFWIAAAWRRPVVWHLHTPNEDFTRFFGAGGAMGWYARAVISKAERVIVLSESWRSLVAPFISDDKVVVIPNPIPDIEAQSTPPAIPEVRRILYLAHLIQRKGYPLLIRAFANAVNRYPDCRLVFAGSGEVKEARQLCNDLGIEDRVEFLGWIEEPQRSDELRKATIFALPSYQEGLPMGILEAMAFGLAVIATPVGGIGDIMFHGVNGLLVSPGDDSELTDALLELLGDRSLCRRLGGQARKDVSSFKAERICGQWINVYQDVLSGFG